MYEDIAAYLAASLIGAFLVLAWVLLSRYRTLNVSLADSVDLGRDLWSSLESRLRKQDERILDVMTKFDVYESRLDKAPRVPEPVTPRAGLTPPSKVEESKSRRYVSGPLEATDRVVLQLLQERPRTSVEIKSLVNKSREHTARLMKSLFERRFVFRDDSKKPFVYQLSEEGRRYLSAS